MKAGPSVRRCFNQAVLEAVYVKDRRIARAEFSEVFAPLFSRPGSNKTLLVVPTGFEPVSPPCGARSWSVLRPASAGAGSSSQGSGPDRTGLQGVPQGGDTGSKPVG